MDFRFTEAEEAFRQQVRGFVAQELPPDWQVRNDREGESNEYFAFSQAFSRKLGDRGWLTMAWPEAYGGRGASPLTQLIYNEEMAYAGAPLGFGFGVNLVGPTLMVWGNEDQKQRHLAPIARSEAFWCQGFSEPGAGSDLAALTTRAQRDGDVYVVNGLKVWSSYAHIARWGILLARTDPLATRHAGISYFVCPMDAPGIEIRPLIDMTGEHAFNEVSFSDVRIPADHLVGAEHAGWELAKVTLGNERASLSGEGVLWGMGPTAEDLVELVRAGGGARVAGLRERLVSVWTESQILRVLRLRTVSAVLAGKAPGPEASVRKAIADGHGQHAMNLSRDLAGPFGMVQESGPDSTWSRGFLYSPALTIGGGTAEVQRNIVAEKVLGLPRDPSSGP